MPAEGTMTIKGKLVWIGLILVVAVWMFVLGIMVGRATAPFDRINASIQEKTGRTQSRPPGERAENTRRSRRSRRS